MSGESKALDCYRMACKCGWKGELPASASDRCPTCRGKLQLDRNESLAIMQQAVRKGLAPKRTEATVTTRAITDKEAPRNEGEWEFQLKEGVLTIIAWNDDKTAASCVRLVRRGTEIHLMQAQKPEQGDE